MNKAQAVQEELIKRFDPFGIITCNCLPRKSAEAAEDAFLKASIAASRMIINAGREYECYDRNARSDLPAG